VKTRQTRKAAAREARRRDYTLPGFQPIMHELHKSGMNHKARRAARAGWFKSPKAGVAWRRTQWLWGMTHHPRRLDRRCFKITGHYLGELAEATSGFVAQAPKAQSRVKRVLAKFGL
jgi:hypothetical protein